jgi:hypothetical protein
MRGYHLRLVPKMANEPLHVRPCLIPLQHKQAAFLIQCIKCSLQIQEEAIKRLLLQVGQLLCQFGLNNGCPGAAAVLASM